MLVNFISKINFLYEISERIRPFIGVIGFIIAGIFVVVYTVWVIEHNPKHNLSTRQIADIKKYGLMHFTDSENVASILEKGLIPNNEKKLFVTEHDLVWTYIANPSQYNKKVREIHKKGKRESYDSVIFLKNISDEDLSKMSCRIFPEAVVYPGTYKTSDMIAKEIDRKSVV